MSIAPDLRYRSQTDSRLLCKANVYEATKRSFDVFGSLIGLLFLFPLFLLVSLMIKLFDGGDVFFRHRRIGRDGQEFSCLKFRTMRPSSSVLLEHHLAVDPAAREEWEANRKLKNDPRISALGGALRKTSIDELPQLINILRGEMSLVGPRPIVREEIAKYGKAFDAYVLVRPGLTGLWQISGRSNTSYEERISLDLQYISLRNTALDFYIILATAPVILRQNGSY